MAKASTEDYRQLKITDIAKYPTGSVITARWTRGGIEQAAIRSYRATENRLILDYRINGEAAPIPSNCCIPPATTAAAAYGLNARNAATASAYCTAGVFSYADTAKT